MLIDHVKKYIKSEFAYGDDHKLYHYNCAETLLNSCNDEYMLGIGTKELKMMTGFGGGFHCERTCGVLTGGIAALGMIFAEERPTENNKLKEIVKKWVEIFHEEFGTTECSDIKKSHRDEVEKCAPVMIRGAELLEKLIEEYR
ncbi:C-GCAxxG-C-C family protein [Alkalibacter mobilis]|uniref:C-GCAxxG-C-C family protein n=1 Tax=Alkalibacter mobilis TaxID=2787712 RepID=UPI00189D61D5|nr:C-GCAxxG-C-C family (seleno)protein [Alkalibacter mobilis]MBF7096603.1 C-GCAxxG-C-C family protein [Alkalibacter mobilis]